MISTKLKKLVDPKNECCCESHLAHKCKEWAIKIDYKIESHIHFINKRIIGVAFFNTQDNTNKFFQADTEPEAIFKACEWIVEQTKCGS